MVETIDSEDLGMVGHDLESPGCHHGCHGTWSARVRLGMDSVQVWIEKNECLGRKSDSC